MVATFVGSDTDGANSTTLTGLVWPTVQAGDFALIVWSFQTTSVASAVTGFTLIDQFDGSPLRMRVLGRVCTGSESGSITLTVDVGNRMSACLVIWRGLHATLPADAWSWRDETVSQSSHPCPAVTPNYSGGVVLSAVGERVAPGTSNWTTAYTERADTLTLAAGAGGTITAVADDGLAGTPTAGNPVTPSNWVSADPISSVNVITFSMSLRPPDAPSASNLPARNRNERARRALLVR